MRGYIVIKDPEFIFGVPDEWKIGIDHNKWEVGEGSTVLYAHTQAISEVVSSNIQYYSASKPFTLFPYDSINLPPITNLCPIQYAGDSLKGGLIEVSVRGAKSDSDAYSETLCANVFFVPASSNFFKPVVGCCKFAPDGKLIWPTEQELEASQK